MRRVYSSSMACPHRTAAVPEDWADAGRAGAARARKAARKTAAGRDGPSSVGPGARSGAWIPLGVSGRGRDHRAPAARGSPPEAWYGTTLPGPRGASGGPRASDTPASRLQPLAGTTSLSPTAEPRIRSGNAGALSNWPGAPRLRSEDRHFGQEGPSCVSYVRFWHGSWSPPWPCSSRPRAQQPRRVGGGRCE